MQKDSLRKLRMLVTSIVAMLTALLAMFASSAVAFVIQIIWVCALLPPMIVAAALVGIVLGVTNKPEPSFSPKSSRAFQWVVCWPLLGDIKLIEGLAARTLHLTGAQRGD